VQALLSLVLIPSTVCYTIHSIHVSQKAPNDAYVTVTVVEEAEEAEEAEEDKEYQEEH